MGCCFGAVAWCPRIGAHLTAYISEATGVLIPELFISRACQVCAPMCLVFAAVISQLSPLPWAPLPSHEPPPAAPASLSRMQRLIRTVGNAEERKKFLDEEAHEAAVIAKALEAQRGVQEQRDATREPPLAHQTPEGDWRISGVYEHQVLKCGLRILDETWSEDALCEFPQNNLIRRGLMTDLLKGIIRLQSVHRNDISSAQYDLRVLTARQLLRLRVLHLGFTPSGCGSDVVGTLGGTHEAFLASMDRLLFEKLGRQAIGSAEAETLTASELHRLGREAVFLTAAAAAIKSPSWWVLWLTSERRVFFHVGRFAVAVEFPPAEDGGVLEVIDLSTPDSQEPTGRLRWFDWRVSLVTQEAKLCTFAPGPDVTATGEGAAVALALSPTLLSGARNNLKKIEPPTAVV